MRYYEKKRGDNLDLISVVSKNHKEMETPAGMSPSFLPAGGIMVRFFIMTADPGGLQYTGRILSQAGTTHPAEGAT